MPMEHVLTAATAIGTADYVRIVKTLATTPESQVIPYNLVMAQDGGWIPVTDTWTFSSASVFTMPATASNTYGVGDKIKFTQGGTVKYGVFSGVGSTAGTIIVNTDYTIANAAISSIYYSHQANPIGFPAYFNWTPTISVSGGTAPTYTATYVSRYSTIGRRIEVKHAFANSSGGTAGGGANRILISIPVATSYFLADASEGEGLGIFYSYESGGTDTQGQVSPSTTNVEFWKTAAAGVLVGNDQSSAARQFYASYNYWF